MTMKVLIVIDGSSCSKMTVNMLKALKLPHKTHVTVMTVVPDHSFLGGLSFSRFKGNSPEKNDLQESLHEQAAYLLQTTAEELSTAKLETEVLVRQGNPAEVILKVARESVPSLIVMGAKGISDSQQFLLGSVAQKVMRHAPTSIMLVKKETTSIDRVLLATDGSGNSEIAAWFLLNLPLPRSEVVLATAVQSYIEAFIKAPTLNLQANQDTIARLQAGEEEEALKIISKIEKLFSKRHYKTLSLVMRGGAAESILKVAKEYKPDLITLGAKGLTAIGPFLLGSVAERVALHAECSVLICRAPIEDASRVPLPPLPRKTNLE